MKIEFIAQYKNKERRFIKNLPAVPSRGDTVVLEEDELSAFYVVTEINWTIYSPFGSFLDVNNDDFADIQVKLAIKDYKNHTEETK